VKCATAILLFPPGYGRGGNICDEYRRALCKQRAGGNMQGVLAANFEISANGSDIAVDDGVRSGNKIPPRNFDRVQRDRGAKYWNAAEPGKPHDRGNPEMAERNLWLSVLETAIVDLQSEQHRQGALRWFTSRRDGVDSCRWVCEHVGFDFEAVRKRIKAVR
jgi:hypothetical protein